MSWGEQLTHFTFFPTRVTVKVQIMSVKLKTLTKDAIYFNDYKITVSCRIKRLRSQRVSVIVRTNIPAEFESFNDGRWRDYK